MKSIKILSVLLGLLIFVKAGAQDTTDLMGQLEKEMGPDKNQTYYTTATFKTTRLVNGIR